MEHLLDIRHHCNWFGPEAEKDAKQVFQARFESPLGEGLRVFRPEPQKG